MTFSWTPHRFTGGALALDVANSVILRFDPARRIDRYADPDALDAFAAAAAMFSAEKMVFGPLEPVAHRNRVTFLDLREAIDAHFRAQVLGDWAGERLADLLDATAIVVRRHAKFSMDCAGSVRMRGDFPPSVPSGHLPLKGGDHSFPSWSTKLAVISPLEGEMSASPTEGGKSPRTERYRSPQHPATTLPLDAATARSALSLITLAEPERLKICPSCQWLFLDRSRNRSRTWCDMTVCGNRVKASRHYRRKTKETTA